APSASRRRGRAMRGVSTRPTALCSRPAFGRKHSLPPSHRRALCETIDAMRRPSSLVAAMLALALGLAGCADAVDDTGSHAAAIAEPGPWQIPPDTLAAGDVQYVGFTGAGPWIGPEGCHGGLTSGAAILRDYLGYAFPQITMIGGYACRAVNGSTTTMSVHATGRALDIFIPVFEIGRAHV